MFIKRQKKIDDEYFLFYILQYNTTQNDRAMSTACAFCFKDFQSKEALEVHYKRKTPCITMEQMIKLKDLYVEQTKHEKELNEKLTFEQESLTDELSNRHVIIKRQRHEIYNLKEALSELLIKKENEEVKPVYWSEIVLIGSFIPKSERKKIKNDCQFIENIDDIKNYILRYSKSIKTVDLHGTKEKKVIITCSNEDDCQICFENKCAKQSKCKVCRFCYMCSTCEKIQVEKFKCCPFCQLAYIGQDCAL